MKDQDASPLLGQASAHLRAEQPPAEQWKSLCEFLSRQSAQEQARLVKPLHAALKPLPDAVRVIPTDWIFRQRQGQRVPAMALARSLVWSSPRLDDQALIDILSYPDLAPLTNLKLFGQAIGSPGARAIAECPRMQNLVSLNLTSNHIDTPGFRALLDPTALPQLERLFLGRNQIRDTEIEWLMQAKIAPSLELLCLRDNPITATVLQAVRVHFDQSGLELRLQSPSAKTSLPRRKRGRPSKKKPQD